MSQRRRARFVTRRKAAGLTQEQLAAALAVDRSTVVRWERAETEPHPSIRPMIARRLGVTLDELDDLLSHTTAAGSRGNGGPAGGRAHIAPTLTILGIPADVHLDGSRVGDDHVAVLASAVHNIEGLDAARGGNVLFGAAQRLYRLGEGWLDDGAVAVARRDEIQSLLGELACWLGWLAFDADRRDHAHRYLSAAMLVARRTDDPFLEVRTLASLSLLSLQARPHEALQYAQVALRLAAGWTTPRLAALLHLRAARAHAAVGDARAFAREVARAAGQLDRGSAPDEPLFVQFMGPSELSGITALAWLALRRPERASTLFADIVDNPDPAYARNVSYYTVRLAESLGRETDIAGACVVARRAVNLVSGLESARTTRLLRQFRRAVEPHVSTSAEARDFAGAYDEIYASG